MDNRGKGVQLGSSSVQQQKSQRTVASQTDFDLGADTSQNHSKNEAATTSKETKGSRRRRRGGTNNGTKSNNSLASNTTSAPATDHKSANKGSQNQGTPNKNGSVSTSNDKSAPASSCGRKQGAMSSNNNNGDNQQAAPRQPDSKLQSATTSLASMKMTTNKKKSSNNNNGEPNKDKKSGQAAVKTSADEQKRVTGSKQVDNSRFKTQSLHSLVLKQQQQNQQLNPSLKPLPPLPQQKQQQLKQQKQHQQQQPQQQRQQKHSYSKQELLSLRTGGDVVKPVESSQSGHKAHEDKHIEVAVSSTTTTCEDDDAIMNEGITSLNLNPNGAQSSGRNIIYMTNRVDYEFKARIMIEAVPFRMPNSE